MKHVLRRFKNSSGAMRNPKCELCGVSVSSENVIANRLRHGIKLDVLQCPSCGLVFLYPKPSEEALREYYASDAYRNMYKDPTDPAEFHQRFRYGDTVQRIERTRDLINEKMDVLEIGAATGFFIEGIKDKVKSVAGIEPNNEFRNYAQKELGLKMYSNLNAARKDRLEYDIAFMFHVLEHIHNPKDFLINIKRLLKRNGKVYIEVPNVKDVLISLYKVPAFRSFYWNYAHLFYFSPETLKLLLQSAGYLIIEMIPIQRYDFSNHLQWMLGGKPGETGKYSKVFDKEFNKCYNRTLAKNMLTDTIVAHAFKR
jgi:2-polyprenyl-3-methyl-5-hydroxy-6-metoxy-1,4-benzoquinol methylase